MANIKSSKRGIRTIAKRTLRNRQVKSKLKTLAKSVQQLAHPGKEAERKLATIEYISALDKAAKRGVIHSNKANRYKSRVAPYLKGVAVADGAESEGLSD